MKRILQQGLLAGVLGVVLWPQPSYGQARQPPAGAASAGAYQSPSRVGGAIVQVDPETRSLIVITDEGTNEHVRRMVETLDQPKPQVLINVLFMEITHRDTLDLGLEGWYTSNAGGDINQSRIRTAWGLAQEMEGGFWNLLADDFETTLRAMAERGKLEVLSRPSILARNNQEAVIMVGEEFPYVTSSRITDSDSVINTIQYAEVGIILRVTPFITTQNMVEMIIAPEISTVTERTVPISDTVRAPIIAKRAAETVVVTPHGQTVVIGGLMETRKTETIRKVPLLGDLPLLGILFRRTLRQDEKKELVIFLTPYIVSRPGELDAVSRQSMRETRLAPALRERGDAQNLLEGVPW